VCFFHLGLPRCVADPLSTSFIDHQVGIDAFKACPAAPLRKQDALIRQNGPSDTHSRSPARSNVFCHQWLGMTNFHSETYNTRFMRPQLGLLVP
jgi:hypothetical protein